MYIFEKIIRKIRKTSLLYLKTIIRLLAIYFVRLPMYNKKKVQNISKLFYNTAF